MSITIQLRTTEKRWAANRSYSKGSIGGAVVQWPQWNTMAGPWQTEDRAPFLPKGTFPKTERGIMKKIKNDETKIWAKNKVTGSQFHTRGKVHCKWLSQIEPWPGTIHHVSNSQLPCTRNPALNMSPPCLNGQEWASTVLPGGVPCQ